MGSQSAVLIGSTLPLHSDVFICEKGRRGLNMLHSFHIANSKCIDVGKRYLVVGQVRFKLTK